MISPDSYRKHINTVLDALGDIDLILDQEILGDDCRHIAEGVKSASREAVRIQPEEVEELWQVKLLHDRVKAVQVSLRILRGSVDRAELSLERAQEALGSIASQVEDPEDEQL